LPDGRRRHLLAGAFRYFVTEEADHQHAKVAADQT